MNEKGAQKNQEEVSESQAIQPVPEAPVLSNLYNIQDVENEKPAVPSIKFNSDEPVGRKHSIWIRNTFIAFVVLQFIGAAIFLYMTKSATQSAVDGAAGSEYLSLLAYILVVPPVMFVAFLNIVGLSVYVVKRKPQGTWLIVAGISLLVSAMMLVYGMYSIYS